MAEEKEKKVAPKKKAEKKQMIVGIKPLDPKKKYKLTRLQRSQLCKSGESMKSVKEELTGAEIMKSPDWKTLGL